MVQRAQKLISKYKFSTLAGDQIPGPDISVIIPAGGEERIPLVQRMLTNIAAQNYTTIKPILAEYGLNGTRVFDWFPHQHVYIEGGELFNKSKAMNAGIMAATSDICVVLDADMLIPDGFFDLVISSISGYDACFLLKRILHCTELDVKHHKLPHIESIRDDNFNGGSIAITKSAYIRIGGMCEDFEGYGYEDVEFWDRLRQLTTLNEKRELDLLHLPHGHVEGYDQHWLANQHLWSALQGENPSARADRFRQALEKYIQVT